MHIEIKSKKKKSKKDSIEVFSLIPKEEREEKKKIKKKVKKKKKSKKIETISIYEEKPKKSPLGIVKKTPTTEEFLKFVSTEWGFLQEFTEVDGYKTDLFKYQINWLKDRSRFKFIAKSRRVGASFIFACEGLAKCHLKKKHKSLYISINQDESSDKVTTARELYFSIPTKWQKKLKVDNKHSLEFETNDGRTRSVLTSFPQRQPRGKGSDVYLDEIAHYMYDHIIWTAALPVISVGRWILSVGSTPLGDKGIFRDIYENEKNQYSMFDCRIIVHWWDCPSLCKDIEEAEEKAPSMPTEERVKKYGTPVLISIYNAMPEEDFQQEYEILFIGELSSFIPKELLKFCIYPEDVSMEDVDPKLYTDIEYPIVSAYRDTKFIRYEELDDVVEAIRKGIIKHPLRGGYDVGRTIDASEFKIFEEIPLHNNTLMVERFTGTYRNHEFSRQKQNIEKFLEALNLKIAVDSNGIGKNLAEDLYHKFPSQVVEIHTTGEWKKEAVSDLKIRFESQCIALQDDRDTVRQIHSIKRKVTETGNISYIADEGKRKAHHADKFWSIALASSISDKPYRSSSLGSFLNKATNKNATLENREKSKNFRKVPISVPGKKSSFLKIPKVTSASFGASSDGFIEDY